MKPAQRTGNETREGPMLIASLQAIVSGLAVGSAYALIALGFSITFTTTKTLNFSHVKSKDIRLDRRSR